MFVYKVVATWVYLHIAVQCMHVIYVDLCSLIVSIVQCLPPHLSSCSLPLSIFVCLYEAKIFFSRLLACTLGHTMLHYMRVHTFTMLCKLLYSCF